jgi:hypothetical protein
MNWLTRGASAGEKQEQQQQQHQYRLFAVEFTSRKSVEIPSQVRHAQAAAALPESPQFFSNFAIVVAPLSMLLFASVFDVSSSSNRNAA